MNGPASERVIVGNCELKVLQVPTVPEQWLIVELAANGDCIPMLVEIVLGVTEQVPAAAFTRQATMKLRG